MESPNSKPSQKISVGQIRLAWFSLGLYLLLLAFVPVLMKLGATEISPTAVTLHSNWIATVVVLLWERLRQDSPSISQQRAEEKPTQKSIYTTEVVGWLVVLGVVSAMNQLLWCWSITQTRVASTAFTYSLTPILTALGESLLWGKRFKPSFLLGMTIAIAGISLVGFSDWQVNTEQLGGDALAAVGTLCFAVYLLSAQRLRDKLGVMTILFWRGLSTTIIALPLLIGDLDAIFPHSVFGWLVILGLVVAMAAQFLIIFSLKTLSASLVGICMMLDPIIAAVIARFTFGEAIGVMTWLAVPIILSGVYVCSTMGLSDLPEPMPESPDTTDTAVTVPPTGLVSATQNEAS